MAVQTRIRVITAVLVATGFAGHLSPQLFAQPSPSATRQAAGQVTGTSAQPAGAMIARIDQLLEDARAMSPTRQLAQRIDRMLEANWRQTGVRPAPLSSDAEFLRRAYLDFTGVIPTAAEVRRFLADRRPYKRRLLVDRLLQHPLHATHLANQLQRVLLPDVQNTNFFLVRGGGLQQWLRQGLADNKPYDQLVYELLAADSAGAAQFYTALGMQPEKVATSVSRMFLGMQFDCAQCHDHPFNEWTQEDFWSFAAFFSGMRQGTKSDGRGARARLVIQQNKVPLKLPDTNVTVTPRFPGGTVGVDVDGVTRRAQAARWITAQDNPYFARATVNRLWKLLFGRGLIDPVDAIDVHAASHPQLLDDLAAWFVRSDFNIRKLLRVLASTKAYHRTSRVASDAYPIPVDSFARMAVKTLTAQQLYDCLRRAAGPSSTNPAGQPILFNPGAVDPNRQMFVAKFSAPGASVTEFHSGIPQALAMINGRMTSQATDLKTSALLQAIDAPFFHEQQRIEVLFLSTLSRLPREDEQKKFLAYVESGGPTGDRRQALADILWALLNSAEFVMNH